MDADVANYFFNIRKIKKIKLQTYWIVALVGFPWTAYGVSQACYYGKSMKENTVGGIKYETALKPSSEEEAFQQ